MSPWVSLSSRRFGGDKCERIITIREDDALSQPITVNVEIIAPNTFNIVVHTSSSETAFTSVHAELVSTTSLRTSLNGKLEQTTIVSQPPPPPASSSPNNTTERLHVFSDGTKTTLVLPTPNWLMSLSGDTLATGKGALKAPMPSLVVDVPVAVGDRVERGQAIVVLESMKTETVLRSDVVGVVRSVGCKKGEMVQEGRELVTIEEDA
jgi:3-methylcrotonyl-CoA carboxylase alpha subunit